MSAGSNNSNSNRNSVCLVAGVVQVVIAERLAIQEEAQIYTEGGVVTLWGRYTQRRR